MVQQYTTHKMMMLSLSSLLTTVHLETIVTKISRAAYG